MSRNGMTFAEALTAAKQRALAPSSRWSALEQLVQPTWWEDEDGVVHEGAPLVSREAVLELIASEGGTDRVWFAKRLRALEREQYPDPQTSDAPSWDANGSPVP